MKVQIRLRAPDGMVRLEVDEESKLGDLVELIKEKTGVKDCSLKYGWPLKALELSPASLQTTVRDLNLRGESIVVVPVETESSRVAAAEPVKQKKQAPVQPKPMEPDETVVEWPERGGFVVLRVMPDDNSCMFTAFGGAIALDDPAKHLRQEVADYIIAHPDQYSKVILGDDPARYTKRMKQSDTWGGAIELSILSDIYDIQICSIDVKSLRVDRFGENKSTCCIILYSGIHYDRIAFSMDLSFPVEVDVTKWATDDEEMVVKATELAQKLNRLHYYTDTTDFVIKCEDCNWIGQGTRDAAEHERKTGHVRFGEMTIE